MVYTNQSTFRHSWSINTLRQGTKLVFALSSSASQRTAVDGDLDAKTEIGSDEKNPIRVSRRIMRVCSFWQTRHIKASVKGR